MEALDGTDGLHALLEQYTPDGAVGRSLLSLASGSAAAFGVWLTLVAFVADSGLLWGLVGALSGGVTLALAALTVAVAWPLYLSLIGHVESASEYDAGGRRDAADRQSAEASRADRLRQRYLDGELSEAEFERELDDLLGKSGDETTARVEREMEGPERA